jgi:hypothetical protein
MTRDDLQNWIDNNKNVKEDCLRELSYDFSERIMHNIRWTKAIDQDIGWVYIYQEFQDKDNILREEPSIAFFLENSHTPLEIAAIQLTLMFNWDESKEGKEYWNNICVALYEEPGRK